MIVKRTCKEKEMTWERVTLKKDNNLLELNKIHLKEQNKSNNEYHENEQLN